MDAVKDSSGLYEVERRARHAERPGFRITELQISVTQKVPWHYHNHVQDTFYVLQGRLRLFLREPKEEISLGPAETYTETCLEPLKQFNEVLGRQLSPSQLNTLYLIPLR